jgi:hypothetical protein
MVLSCTLLADYWSREYVAATVYKAAGGDNRFPHHDFPRQCVSLLSRLWSTATRSTPQEKCHRKVQHSVYILRMGGGSNPSVFFYPIPSNLCHPCAVVYCSRMRLLALHLHRISQLVCDKMPRPELTFPSWLPGFLSYCESSLAWCFEP